MALLASESCVTCDLMKVGVTFEDPYALVTDLVILLG